METIKSIQEDSITITKTEDKIIERNEIKEKIAFLESEVVNLTLALEGRQADLIYYKDLIGKMPKEKIIVEKEIIK